MNNKDKILYFIKNISKHNCNKLDIGSNVGITNYIDFIEEKDVIYNIMKGYDIYNRFFIVIKSNYIYDDNSKKETFSTFFQRYTDDYLLWCCCSYDGTNFMDTVGGMNVNQFEFLFSLLYNSSVDLDLEKIEKFKLLNYKYNNKYPIKLQLLK